MVASVIDRHIAEWMRRPFRFGSDDCAFAVRAILQEAGATSVYQNRIGEFTAPGSIAEFVARETAGGGLAALVLKVARDHGWRRIRTSEAVDGDLALFRGPRREPIVGIVRGPMIMTRAQPRGAVGLPKSMGSVAFRVNYGA